MLKKSTKFYMGLLFAIIALFAISFNVIAATDSDYQTLENTYINKGSNAQSEVALPNDVAAEESWNIHGQFTYVNQWHPSFNAPYSGANSLDSGSRQAHTNDMTLFAGVRLWRGAEFYLNPEFDQGFGFNNTLGVAGFTSAEAYKVGRNTPYFRLPRAFLRQVIDLGGEQQTIDSSANQLAGAKTANNMVLTAGKFSVVDIFDTNTYAHDPRADFLNWSIVDTGTFDYAADAWGFTYGAAAEWFRGSRTLRAGLFQLSKVPNGKVT